MQATREREQTDLMIARDHRLLQERGAATSRFVVAAVAVILALLVSSIPASAEVRAGKNVTVFHNSDFIGATGYPVGEDMTIELWREGINIGSATGPAADTPEGPGLEVNHGPEGAPQPGDCWDGITPDVLPGDEVRVIGDGGTDSVIVADINFDDGYPIEVTAGNIAQHPGAQEGDVILEGTAFNQDATPMNPNQLAGEFRIQPNPRYRTEPNVIEDLGGGAWRAVYRPPYVIGDERDNLSNAQKKAALLNPNAEHAIVFAPTESEVHIAENGGEGGPALGCEGSPRSANAVTTFDDRAVNLTSESLVANGTALDGTTAVSVSLDDQDPATPAVEKDATVNGTAWTVTFDRNDTELLSLSDGRLTATGTYTGTNVPTTGATKSIQKDLVAPALTADPPPGTYTGAQSVALSSDGNEQIRYSTDGNPPNDNSRVYDGQRITVERTLDIRAFSTDAAGNRAEETFAYTINAVPTVRALSPRENARTNLKRVKIRAVVSDDANLAKADIQLFFDGKAKAFRYNEDTDRLTTRSPRLSRGKHTIRVVVDDGQGGETTKTWSFRKRGR